MSEQALVALVQAAHAAAPSAVPDLATHEPALIDVSIRAITQDSRTVVDGSLFCAIRGVSVDGHDFIEPAVASGAVAVVAEEIRTERVPTLLTSDARAATAHLAAQFFDRPSEHLDLIGVTGTNGKTTIVSLLEHVATILGRSAQSFGTLTGSLTTADAPEFQRRLREAADGGVDVVAAEVSSHALDQYRVDGSTFRLALFTNLTQDHLDYHVDMEDYFTTKARLFTGGLAQAAIIDVSTEYGRRLAEIASIPVRAVDTAHVDVQNIGPEGSRFLWSGHSIDLPLAGRFNITNAVLVAETFAELGERPENIARALGTVPQVPGRFEWVAGGGEASGFGVVVDYSHTPASLQTAVATSQELSDGRVLVVFGCGGDRDLGKRPLMGAAASAADVVFVTSDNPRTEDPEAIIDQIAAGIDHPDVRRDVDRGSAIRAAIFEAEAGDLVLIAGKGHENYQLIGTSRLDFDDRVVAQAALRERGETGA